MAVGEKPTARTHQRGTMVEEHVRQGLIEHSTLKPPKQTRHIRFGAIQRHAELVMNTAVGVDELDVQ